MHDYDYVKELGVVLSGATVRRAKMQPRYDAENVIKEGMFVKIDLGQEFILSRIVEIKHVHEFYQEGDIWTEARRFGEEVPATVARAYTTADLELLNLVTEHGLEMVNQAPKPGSKVYKLTMKDLCKVFNINFEDLKEAIEKDRSLEYKITFGNLLGYRNIPLILDLNNITMHLAIVGTTGSGKSYTTGYFFERISRISVKGSNKAIPVIVFDANGDYLDYVMSLNPREYLEGFKEFYRFVFSQALESIRAAPSKHVTIDEIKIDLNILNSSSLAELIMQYYRGGELAGSELQLMFLTELLNILEKYAYEKVDYNRLITANILKEIIERSFEELPQYKKTDKPSTSFLNFIKAVYERLNNQIKENEERLAKEILDLIRIQHRETLNAVKRALSKFSQELKVIIPSSKGDSTINEEFIERITDTRNPGFTVIDFSADGAPGIPLSIKQVVVYYILKLVFDKFTKYKIKGKTRLLLLALEEAQNYAPNTYVYPVAFSIAKNVLATLATQGRKFGVSLVIITQRPSFVDPIVMSMINTYIIHRVSYSDIDFVLKVTGGLPPHLVSRLANLKRGTAIVTGQMSTMPFPMIIEIPRRRAPHRAGTFNIGSCLGT